jgi:hypothetical protein
VYILKVVLSVKILKKKNETPWPESAGELYRLSNRRLSAMFSLNLSQDAGCPEYDDLDFPNPSSPIPRYYFDPTMTASFQILSNSSVIVPFNTI